MTGGRCARPLPVFCRLPARTLLKRISLACSFKRRFPRFVAQDDQVTAEERTEPATSGGSRPLQLRFPNCIERARKKLQ